jgi:NAD(P)H-dependent flavin oxidoreductase YrpB (nitropropane dioxygenase family)
VLETAFTQLIGCTAPIQVAPMGAIGTPDLIRAVSGAGALGMVGTAGMSAEQVTSMLDAVLDLAEGPVGANMLMPFADRAVVEAAAPRVRVFDFYHGAPDRSLIAAVHGAGSLASWQVGSVEEAKAAVDAGCDLIAVRGIEGGGRMHGNQPLWPLLNSVLDAVGVPVLAAGGLATARDLAAVLAAGADGARMGTRFVATDESGAHPLYKQAIVAATGADTELVTDFSVFWPSGPEPHRVLRKAVDAARSLESEVAGEGMLFGERRPIPKFAVAPPAADTTGAIEAFAMYAGVSVGAIDRIEPAADVVHRLVSGAERLLRQRWTPDDG